MFIALINIQGEMKTYFYQCIKYIKINHLYSYALISSVLTIQCLVALISLIAKGNVLSDWLIVGLLSSIGMAGLTAVLNCYFQRHLFTLENTSGLLNQALNNKQQI